MRPSRLSLGIAVLFAAVCCRALTAQAPHITAITSAAVLGTPAPDGLATLYGTGLSDKIYQPASLPLPQQLGPASLSICSTSNAFACVAALLLYVSPTQINFYIPAIRSASSGAFDFGNNFSATYTVTVGSQTARLAGMLSAEAPSIFSIGYDCNFDPIYGDPSKCGLSPTSLGSQQVQRGSIVDRQGNPVTSLNPARPGQYYSIYLTGLNLTTAQPAALAATANVTLSAVPTPQNPLNGPAFGSIVPSYAGPSSFSGLQQVNFLLDPSLFGDAPSGTLFTCADYHFELLIGFSVGSGSADQHTDSLPVLVKNGDVPCAP